MLPILHLNGYKIANPTVLARIPEDELVALFEGYGYRPIVVAGGFDGEPGGSPPALRGGAGRRARRDRARSRRRPRRRRRATRPRWPMIVLRTPEGLDRPERGRRPADRGHVALAPGSDDRRARRTRSTCELLEEWMRSYRPEELFDENGRLVPELAELPPKGERRMSANPHANGGELLRELALPDFREYAVDVPEPGRPRSARRREFSARSCAT